MDNVDLPLANDRRGAAQLTPVTMHRRGDALDAHTIEPVPQPVSRSAQYADFMAQFDHLLDKQIGMNHRAVDVATGVDFQNFQWATIGQGSRVQPWPERTAKVDLAGVSGHKESSPQAFLSTPFDASTCRSRLVEKAALRSSL